MFVLAIVVMVRVVILIMNRERLQRTRRLRMQAAGVNPDLAQANFEPYARAHHAGTQPASVGLGLSVPREPARLMDGDIVYGRAGE